MTTETRPPCGKEVGPRDTSIDAEFWHVEATRLRKIVRDQGAAIVGALAALSTGDVDDAIGSLVAVVKPGNKLLDL